MLGPMSTPYRASWVDRLIAWIAALPGPTWATYVIVSAVVGLLVHAAAWVDGLLAPGDVDLFLSSLAIYVVFSLAAMQFLDHRASVAWTTFRPVASVTDEQAERIRFELTTLPARSVL